jgi:hypothetical protein
VALPGRVAPSAAGTKPRLSTPGERRRKRQENLPFRWSAALSEDQWKIYSKAIDAVRSSGVLFMLGGGFALASFTGRWRDTKDIDFYIHPQDREQVIEALSQAGFKDYYSKLPYDRKWIYRSVQSDVIVDIIWSMANQRAQVDDLWFQRAGALDLRAQHLLVIPAEELMWCKLYILQRDHCDWVDVFNLIYAVGPKLDWDHLIWRLEDDLPLLRAVLQVYGWLCPAHVLELPGELWASLGMPVPEQRVAKSSAPDKIRLLDSRGWFAALQPSSRKLEV